MKINLATCSRAALPLINLLEKQGRINKIFIPESHRSFGEHIKAVSKDLPIIVCKKTEVDEQDLTIGSDLLLVFGFPYKLPSYSKKAYNVHFGELPENRGPEPLFWTLKYGKKIAYITIHEITRSFDSGPIYSQKGYPILPGENEGLLNSRLGNLIIPQIESFLNDMPPPKDQNQEEVQYFSHPQDQDLKINWQKMRGEEIQNLANACNPNYIGARTSFNGVPIQLVEVYVHPQFELSEEQKTKTPGQVILANQQGLAVLTSDGLPLFISVAHMHEGTFSSIKLMQLGINEETIFE